MEAADLVVINTCAIREAAEAKVDRAPGPPRPAQGREPGAARRPDRLLGPRVEPRPASRGATRRWTCSCGPTRSPSSSTAWGSRRRRRRSGALAMTAATTLVKGAPVSDATHLVRARADAIAGGAVSRASAISAWLPIIYGCDKTCTYCIVPFSRGPERSRPFDEIVDEARALAAAGFREVTLLGQNVNSYGHDLPAEPRFAHVDDRPHRRAGTRTARRARTSRSSSGRSTALRTADGAPAIPRLRFVTSHPWDLSDRLIDAMADCPSRVRVAPPAGPVGLGLDAPPDGPPVHDRATTSSGSRGSASAVPGHRALDRRHRRVLRRDRGRVRGDARACSRRSASTRSSRPPTASGPGTPGHAARGRRPRGREAPPARRRCSGVQEAIGLERNRAWLGRTTEVLVDTDRPAALPRPRRPTRRPGTRRVARRLRAPPRRRRRTSPAAPARTSSSTSPGSPALLGPARAGDDRARRARTRCAARSPEPGRRCPPPRSSSSAARPPPARPGLAIALAERPRRPRASRPRSCRRTRGRSTGASTSGRPRRRPRSGRGSSTTASTSSIPTSRTRSPSSARTRWAPSRRSGTRGGVGILAGGTGLLAARGRRRASTPTRCRRTPAVRAGARGGPRARRRRGARGTPRDPGADARGARRPAQPAARRPRARDRDAPRATRRCRAPLGYPAPVLGLQLVVEPAELRRRIAARARAQFDAGLVEEARALRERFDPALPAFSAIGYRESWAFLDGLVLARGGDRARRAAQRRLREAPADLVPARAVARESLDATADPARTCGARSNAFVDGLPRSRRSR